MMEITFLLTILLVYGGIAVGIILVARAVLRRLMQSNRRRIIRGLSASVATALVVFLLTYTAAWTVLRSVVTRNANNQWFRTICNFQRIREGLSDFAQKNGRYPESLDELAKWKGSSEEWQQLDPWEHPYQYVRTDSGFRLFSFGPDGKPGGVGLDADIESTPHGATRVIPTLKQFLFEIPERKGLLVIALLTSLCAAVACFVADGPVEKDQGAGTSVLVSIVQTTFGAILVAIALIVVHIGGQGH
jgi:general secretion pathway protein G